MRKWIVAVLMFGIAAAAWAKFDLRRQILGWMEKSGMEKYIEAPVEIAPGPGGIVQIRDTGLFIVQHSLLTPEVAAEPNVVVDAGLRIPATVDKLVIVTHGWQDKGQEDWPSEMAAAITARTDPNQWAVIAYDWKGGSGVITSVMAAEYARDIAGPRLAAAVLKIFPQIRHVHLVGHSAGSWTIQVAGERLRQAFPAASVHLTFLDAYVPSKWDPDRLGNLPAMQLAPAAGVCWADHYYTRDITLDVTKHRFKQAHNVDLTEVDPWFAEHEFPYRWYLATITGHYQRWDEKREQLHHTAAGIEYGWVRSRECSQADWVQSLTLPEGGRAVKIRKKK